MENNAECKKQIMEMLNESPDLTVYNYRPWSDEQRNKLHTILQDISGNPGESYRKLTPEEKGETKTDTPKAKETAKEPATKSESKGDDDMEAWLNGVG